MTTNDVTSGAKGPDVTNPFSLKDSTLSQTEESHKLFLKSLSKSTEFQALLREELKKAIQPDWETMKEELASKTDAICSETFDTLQGSQLAHSEHVQKTLTVMEEVHLDRIQELSQKLDGLDEKVSTKLPMLLQKVSDLEKSNKKLSKKLSKKIRQESDSDISKSEMRLRRSTRRKKRISERSLPKKSDYRNLGEDSSSSETDNESEVQY